MLTHIEINSIKSLFEYLNSLNNSFVFRGHKSSKWKLESSLVRSILAKDPETIQEIENTSLSEFKSKYLIYRGINNIPSSTLSWLSIMQHFGVPTRLIDFTLSPFVALGFILEDMTSEFLKPDSKFSLYLLNYTKPNNIFIDNLPNFGLYDKLTLEDLSKKTEEIFEKIYKNNNKFFMVSEPAYSNIRIDRQNGTFLISNRFINIEEELSKDEYNDIDFRKIDISSALYIDIFKMLRKMNINSKMIYGDLSGLSKSIKSEMFYNSFLRLQSNIVAYVRSKTKKQ